MKIGNLYFGASLWPALSVFLLGLLQMPENCNRCILLLLIGSGMIFLSMLVLNMTYFLLRIEIQIKLFKIVYGLLCCLLPAFILGLYLFATYYQSSFQESTDLRISIPAFITSWILSSWIMYLYFQGKLKNAKK